MEIRIDDELMNLIPPLSDEELKNLEMSIKAEGIREPIIVTGDGVVVDGHNRLIISDKLKLDENQIPIKIMRFENRSETMLWMIDNQRGRRNLSRQAWLDLGFKRAELLKPMAEANLHRSPGPNGFQKSEKLSESEKINTVKEAADYAGVSVDTAAKYKRVMSDAPEEVKEKVRTGDTSINRAYQEIKRPHVSHNSGENEWYTPQKFIDSARAVMGSIDTDPASSDIANKKVNAGIYFTKDNDGLKQEWHGNVWMNPPYAQPIISHFSDAVVEKFFSGEIKQAIILVNNGTETGWFQNMLSAASAVCFPKSRIKFIDMNGNPSGAPLQGQAIIYMGENIKSFSEEFSNYGKVLYGAV